MAKDLISDGLAVSYYYNFVKRLLDNIGSDSQVRINQLKYPFPYDQVQIKILLPKGLNAFEIERCKDFVFASNEVRLSVNRGRDMSFFVENLEVIEKQVVDFPTTLESIIEYLTIDIDNLSGFVDTDVTSEEWEERENLELGKFKSMLEFLIDNYETTRGKVNVLYLE